MTTTQHVLNVQRVFPIGTSVKAIPQSNWAVNQLPPSADQGAATDTKTVQADGTLTFTGLTAKTRYFAVATVNSVYRYVSFICGDAADLSTPDSFVTQGQFFPNNSAYRLLHLTACTLPAAATQNTNYLVADTNKPANSNVDVTQVPYGFYLTAADLAVAGLTTKLMMRVTIGTKSLAPGVTFTIGLYPFTITGGASALAIGTLVPGSTSTITTPGASLFVPATSGDFILPADGFYVPVISFTGAATLAAGIWCVARTLVRNV